MAYPPSPIGDAQRERITLTFHDGSVKPGQSIRAKGTLDSQSNSIRVGDEGDFIITSP
jgi:hypothetical protein